MEIEVQGSRGGCGCASCLSSMFGLGMAIVLPIGILMIVESSRTGSDAAAIEAFEACSPVTEALGQPLERVPWSPGCGEYEGGGGHADANFSMKIRGPKGSASAWYQASHNGGPWTVNRATVDLPSGQITAVPCEVEAPSPRPSPAPKKKRRKGG